MSLILSEMRKAQRWITVEVPLPAAAATDEVPGAPLQIRVAYNPYTWTPAYKREYNRLQEETQRLLDALREVSDPEAVQAALAAYQAGQREWFNTTLPKLLVAWEIYATAEDEAAQHPLAIDYATIDAEVPDEVMSAIFLAIGKDREAAETNFTKRESGSAPGSTTPASTRSARRKRTT